MDVFLLVAVHKDHEKKYSSHIFSIYKDFILFETKLNTKSTLKMDIWNHVIHQVPMKPKMKVIRQIKEPWFFHLDHCYILKKIRYSNLYLHI